MVVLDLVGWDQKVTMVENFIGQVAMSPSSDLHKIARTMIASSGQCTFASFMTVGSH